MKQRELKKIFMDTDFVHTSGSEEEKKVAYYLKEKCEDMGLKAYIEEFDVDMANIHEAKLCIDGKEYPCKGLANSGSGEITGELYYMPGFDKVALSGCKDKIVLLDVQGVNKFVYEDIVKAGAKGLIFQYGNAQFNNNDIDQRDLRKAVVGDNEKLLSVMINVKDGIKIVKSKAQRASIVLKQDEYVGKSYNVICDIEGESDEYVLMSAHLDSVSTSHGAYDNMTGCAGLLGVLDNLKNKKHHYNLRAVFCGSEERGLLGSKAYVLKHKEELQKVVLNVNLDMIGTYMGKFITCVSAEEGLLNYVNYLAMEKGFSISGRIGVYSSDSTPFADNGVPALSFARIAPSSMAPIHCRYDLMDLLSMEQLIKDIDFITDFVKHMIDAKICPVKREIPESVKKELDIYLFRKRKDA